jgi:hypothetical protein
MNFNTQPNRAQQSHSKDFRRRETEKTSKEKTATGGTLDVTYYEDGSSTVHHGFCGNVDYDEHGNEC